MNRRIIGVILAAIFIVALPFLFRKPATTGAWHEGDPVLTIVTPHNEAIRYEFAQRFCEWHNEKYGVPVRIDWRVIGGTTEIMRYLASEYIGSMKGWWKRQDREWPAEGADWILDRQYDPYGAEATNGDERVALRRGLFLDFRTNDSPDVATSGIDLFFGGGVYDHSKAERQGLTVAPWKDDAEIPVGLFRDERGKELFPAEMAGEVWRSRVFFGNVLSTFGICWNQDRLNDLGVPRPPARWADLTAPAYFGEIGVADPTKSGSVAKAYELIVQQSAGESVQAAGYDDETVTAYEKAIAEARLPVGDLPENVPAAYQEAVARSWADGINLVRLIGANARYFTDSAGKVPIDVGNGATAAGICIDFFGRFQAEYAKGVDGKPHMEFATPIGGSCVSADPISLLRGARNRELAIRFMTFVLGEDGQKLWNGRPGTDGGPEKFALRRLPIRRDFYPSDDPVFQAKATSHLANASDHLDAPDVNPYALAGTFTYRSRWTGRHFGIQRDLIRALCLDSGVELRAAWRAILAHGGPGANPEAMAVLNRLPRHPVPVTWKTAITDYNHIPRLQYMREWTADFRANYREAARIASAHGE